MANISKNGLNKGTKVIVTTTNGGQSEGVITSDYTPSFSITLVTEFAPKGFTIPSWRIKTVEALGERIEFKRSSLADL